MYSITIILIGTQIDYSHSTNLSATDDKNNNIIMWTTIYNETLFTSLYCCLQETFRFVGILNNAKHQSNFLYNRSIKILNATLLQIAVYSIIQNIEL